MHRLFYISLLLTLPLSLMGQDSAETAIEAPRPTVPVALELQEKVWFTDRMATAVIYFDSEVEAPESAQSNYADISLLEIELHQTKDSKLGQHAAVIRFLPRKTGPLTLPRLSFPGGDQVYQTESVTIEVSQPIQSDQMSLKIVPQKLRVYVGEALQLDLVWESVINPAQLKALQIYPTFFNDSNIEIVIPRNTGSEKQQMGLPIGGRRVIATREMSAGQPKALGQVKLPLYLRFAQPGIYTLPATRLECAQLKDNGTGFARYAAHFNNELFESVDRNKLYRRIYTTAPAIEVEVLPLPANETGQAFSGLFAPLEIDVALQPTEIEIGQLMQLDLKVSGTTPHGLIDLPALRYQTSLRGRFLVDHEVGRRWHAEGSLFRMRLRALSTTVDAFPSLQFLVLDPKTGRYVTQSTAPIPLKTLPSNGQNFIPLNTFQGAAVTLTQQPAGIWHNLKANRMNDLLNALLDLLNRNFWPALALGPILFFGLLPLVRDRRRRAKDPQHRLRAEAYKRFKQIAPDAPEKWPAFLDFMAVHFESAGSAWTLSDSLQALQSIHAEPEVIQQVTAWHQAADARDFSRPQPSAEFAQLDSVAKRVLQGISRCALVLLCLSVLTTSPTEAATTAEWSKAEQSFAQAQAEPTGSEAAHALYAQAALKFESAARANLHSGEAWLNAGNAWFEAGAIGRAIAAYRSALAYRPFDARLSESLAAARALRLNEIPNAGSVWQQVPTRWIKAMVVLSHLIFWISLLFVLRYRSRWLILSTSTLGLVALLSSSLLWQRAATQATAGVLIVETFDAKKGPDYAYANAFNASLYDGVEFFIIENRDAWCFVELTDGRRCWLLNSQITRLDW